MRILCLSDTHGRHNRFAHLPPADVFLHAGDFTRYGSGAEEFAVWFHRLPYKYKLLTLGNHERADSVAKPPPEHWRSLFGPLLLIDRGARISVDGRDLTVFGLPSAPASESIPHGIDVVLSHEPPYRLLDRTHNGANAGSEKVDALVRDARPRVHAFGHVHAQGGEHVVEDGVVYLNAATRPVLLDAGESSVEVVDFRYSSPSK